MDSKIANDETEEDLQRQDSFRNKDTADSDENDKSLEENLGTSVSAQVARQTSYNRDVTFEEDENQNGKQNHDDIARMYSVQEEGDEQGKNKLKQIDDIPMGAESFTESQGGENFTNLKSDKTLEDEDKCQNSDFRKHDTEEDSQPLDSCIPESMKETKIIFKVMNVREHPQNKDPPAHMIRMLPTELIRKQIGNEAVMGRGEDVDIYLHDRIASRYHVKLLVAKDSNKMIFEVINISKTKKIKVNGTTEIDTGCRIIWKNNDQLTVGCFTFLIEISLGHPNSETYQLKFIYPSNCEPNVCQSVSNPILYSHQMTQPTASYNNQPTLIYGNNFQNNPQMHMNQPVMYQQFQSVPQGMVQGIALLPQGIQTVPPAISAMPQPIYAMPHAPVMSQTIPTMGPVMSSMPQGIPVLPQGISTMNQGMTNAAFRVEGYPHQNWLFQQPQNQSYIQQFANMNLMNAGQFAGRQRMPQEHDDSLLNQPEELWKKK